MRWDIFCRVIDNLGDAGVCWRLAADLGARGDDVRLWIDEPAPLANIAPQGGQGAPGVQVHRWADEGPWPEPADVVVEAFGCDPPPDFVARMAAQARPPCWLNLEYLSAEAYVERSHALPSPQFSGPGRGLVKHFFYPGFTPRTGGLLREPGLLARRQAFDRDAWLAARGLARRPGERVVLLFAYDNPALPALLDALAAEPRPTLLLAAAGGTSQQVQAVLGPGGATGALRAVPLPWLAQPEFDHALWSADLNFVRGEDSFVRAQWAGAPFVWQIYPQHDGAHEAKLEAFLARHLQQAPAPLAGQVRALWRGWNGLAPQAARSAAWPSWPDPGAWAAATRAWRDQLQAQDDLATQLRAFAQAFLGALVQAQAGPGGVPG